MKGQSELKAWSSGFRATARWKWKALACPESQYWCRRRKGLCSSRDVSYQVVVRKAPSDNGREEGVTFWMIRQGQEQISRITMGIWYLVLSKVCKWKRRASVNTWLAEKPWLRKRNPIFSIPRNQQHSCFISCNTYHTYPNQKYLPATDAILTLPWWYPDVFGQWGRHVFILSADSKLEYQKKTTYRPHYSEILLWWRWSDEVQRGGSRG